MDVVHKKSLLDLRIGIGAFTKIRHPFKKVFKKKKHHRLSP